MTRLTANSRFSESKSCTPSSISWCPIGRKQLEKLWFKWILSYEMKFIRDKFKELPELMPQTPIKQAWESIQAAHWKKTREVQLAGRITWIHKLMYVIWPQKWACSWIILYKMMPGIASLLGGSCLSRKMDEVEEDLQRVNKMVDCENDDSVKWWKHSACLT